MIDISVEIGGRKVNPKNMKDEIEGMIVSGIVDSVKKSVRGIRCSEHGKTPRMKIIGRNIDNLSIEVSGCCDALKDQVQRKLK